MRLLYIPIKCRAFLTKIEKSQVLPGKFPHTRVIRIPLKPLTNLANNMKNILNTENVIEDLVAVSCGDNASEHQKHIYRETLRSLVRLAKSEQMRDIKMSVEKLTGAILARPMLAP
jgi:hypothetical protein